MAEGFVERASAVSDSMPDGWLGDMLRERVCSLCGTTYRECDNFMLRCRQGTHVARMNKETGRWACCGMRIGHRTTVGCVAADHTDAGTQQRFRPTADRVAIVPAYVWDTVMTPHVARTEYVDETGERRAHVVIFRYDYKTAKAVADAVPREFRIRD